MRVGLMVDGAHGRHEGVGAKQAEGVFEAVRAAAEQGAVSEDVPRRLPDLAPRDVADGRSGPEQIRDRDPDGRQRHARRGQKRLARPAPAHQPIGRSTHRGAEPRAARSARVEAARDEKRRDHGRGPAARVDAP